jgi:hypothetical protein
LPKVGGGGVGAAAEAGEKQGKVTVGGGVTYFN